MKHVTEAKAVVIKDTPDYYAVQIDNILFEPGTLRFEKSAEPGKVLVSFVCDADEDVIKLFKENH